MRTGQAIRNSQRFSDGFCTKMEAFLRNRDEAVSLMFPDQEETITSADYSFESSFLALAAPSMEGKTQFAFTCRDPKPLYFPMTQFDSTSQPIYSNFKGLAKTLYDCAHQDWKLLKNDVPSPTRLNSNSFDSGDLVDVKLFTLGLLKGLIENVVVLEGKTWMEALSECRTFFICSN